MIVIGIRCDVGTIWRDDWKFGPGVRPCHLSPSQDLQGIDLCFYLFSENREGLGLTISESSSQSEAKLCVIDQSYSPDTAVLLVKGGCHGYALFESINQHVIGRIMSELLAGGYWVPRLVLERVVEEITIDREDVVGSVCQGLSPRENEVALWIGRGLSNKRIARELGVTERTVKAHLSNIFQKTPVSDRLELALLMNGELPERVRVDLK
jgi:DNA-binding NarL/FixJ family response regulator